MNPPLDLLCAEVNLAEPLLTPCDHEHAVTYIRILDADAEGADRREISRIVLHIEPDRDALGRRALTRAISRACQVDEQRRLPATDAERMASLT